jgi:hypothetical protein
LSKSEGVNVCTDDDAKGYIEVTNDDLGTNENVVVAMKGKRVVCVCHDGERYEVRGYESDSRILLRTNLNLKPRLSAKSAVGWYEETIRLNS